MSLAGDINKLSGDVRRAIASIAAKELTDTSGAPLGTRKIWGYVCNYHEDGDLKGTIDVQEYDYEPNEVTPEGAGHHEGVLLSAIQDNKEGFLIVPQLYSDVIIVRNPIDGAEYVLMYSHAKRVQINAHEDVQISVTEYEDFTETDEGLDKDYDELEPTGNFSKTLHSSTAITSQVGSKDDSEGCKTETTAEGKTITVGNTTIAIKGDQVTIETNSKVSFKVGSTELECSDSEVNIKTNTAKIDSSSCEVKGSDVKVNGNMVTITGGSLKTQGACAPDLNGPYNAIKVCPFSGAPHCGSMVSGT